MGHALIPVITVLSLLVSQGLPFFSLQTTSGVYVVTVFPNLVSDIKLLLCDGDVVDYIIPPGVDPHEYQLSISDYQKLKRASIIVSTGHTGAEAEIEELVKKGELNATLINILEIPGIRITINPSSGQANLHMPIYDPLNYILFVGNLTSTLAKANPLKADCYRDKALKLVNSLISLVNKMIGKYRDVSTIIDLPGIQYAVEWMGFKVVKSLVPEHEVQPSPQDIASVESFMKSGSTPLVFVTSPAASSEGNALIELSKKYNVTIIEVPSPLVNGSIPDKLYYISSQVSGVNIKEAGEPSTKLEGPSHLASDPLFIILYVVIGVIIGLALSRWVYR
ncbi:MAG: metal ABC transporter substrate-binding protein [Desulfurococcus sp.]|uniref:metal ABC transporter substrate-binding protein n=1 Tax=Desulfurococcus sp. TaxID=51678 RepID=UPI003D14322C